MKILVTGAEGFIGKNLSAILGTLDKVEIYQYDIDSDQTQLDSYTKDCEYVFHLAGVNRPQNSDEFMEGNYGFTKTLLESLKKNHNTCPVLITSSIQATIDNPYGQSKKAAEDLIFTYGKETGSKVLVYRFPNVFGKWCRPNYNSGVATFCHNIARDLPIWVSDHNVDMKLIYIDDIVDEFISALNGNETREGDYCFVPIIHSIKLGEIVDLIYSFKNSRSDLSISNMADDFTRKLYATYLSYLPEDQFVYPLKKNVDNRGSFTEIIRTPERGQFSVNISKPGITKGNHWHRTKNEKFLVVSGTGVIRFRRVDSDEVIEYYVNGENLEIVDIPPGYTHNIENTGDSDLITFMWANECFNPDKPDTYYLEV